MQPRYKYPKTPHLPWSETIGADDKKLKDDSQFCGRRVVITEKMDGENTIIYRDGYHARSIDSVHRGYHSWLLAHLPQFQYLLNKNERICREYLYAKHSIYYNNLADYFLGFSIWTNNICWSWEDSIKEFNRLNLALVPIIYIGEYNRDIMLQSAKEVIAEGGEGIVVRNADSFTLNEFPHNIAKYVRPNHVQTDEHWSQGIIECNQLWQK